METVSTIFIQCILFAIKIFIYIFNVVLKVSQLMAVVGKFMSTVSSKLVFSYYQFDNRSSKCGLVLGM